MDTIMNSIASDTVSGSQAHEPRCWSCKPTQPQLVGVMQQEPCAFSRSGSLCSSQTVLESTCEGPVEQSGREQSPAEDIDVFCACSPEIIQSVSEQQSWLEAGGRNIPAATYAACTEMIRRHKHCEQPYVEHLATLADGACCADDSARMIVVSWLVEVAEEFGLQQETLHAAVAMLDRFLSSSNGVPRCVLQLVAVGCIFLASKQHEVHHPTVEQLVAVAAHSFTAADLLRVERILLDTLDFNITLPTPYSFLHLLTQATLAATHCESSSLWLPPDVSAAVAAAAAAPSPPMEVVVSLAMYLTELALLDHSCTALPGSTIATASLLLAHVTLSGHCQSWRLVMAAAGSTAEDVAAAVAAVRRLHIAAATPASAQIAELVLPLKHKFSQDCWCRVAADITPLDTQQQQQQAVMQGL